ncbi:MAG: hypothetical protein WAO71_07885, partial [Gallionella sp.]
RLAGCDARRKLRRVVTSHKQFATQQRARETMNKWVNCGVARYIHMRITHKEMKMHKRMTITLDEVVYEGLYRMVGKRRMSQFIEDLVRAHVVDTSLDDGYRAMAADKARETDAIEWCNALAGDMSNAAR